MSISSEFVKGEFINMILLQIKFNKREGKSWRKKILKQKFTLHIKTESNLAPKPREKERKHTSSIAITFLPLQNIH